MHEFVYSIPTGYKEVLLHFGRTLTYACKVPLDKFWNAPKFWKIVVSTGARDILQINKRFYYTDTTVFQALNTS